MRFVKANELKEGMRLAKAIYNKNGVLLFERDSKLTSQGISSVINNGLIGIYILDPSEPLPPISADDVEFEIFQTVSFFKIKDELTNILKKGRYLKMPLFAQEVISKYGRLDHKINFVQNLRSKEDFIYKHSLNVAILCALISHHMNMKPADQESLVMAALIHDIGKLNIPRSLLDKKNRTAEDIASMKSYEREGVRLSEDAFASTPNIKRMINQAFNEYDAFASGSKAAGKKDPGKLVDGAKILIVANDYDKMTAMNNYEEPKSEIVAIKFLLSHPEMYDQEAVKALEKSINILNEGCCVKLSNGKKGLVISHNPINFLRPVILLFDTNTIVDLYRDMGEYQAVEIEDVVKTLDNRHVMDTSTVESLKK